MSSPNERWRNVRIEIKTSDTVPVADYRKLAKDWIGAASEQNINVKLLGLSQEGRVADYASCNAEYVALIGIGEELIILSLSNFNAVACNVPTRMLEARTLEPCDDLRSLFDYTGVNPARQ